MMPQSDFFAQLCVFLRELCGFDRLFYRKGRKEFAKPRKVGVLAFTVAVSTDLLGRLAFRVPANLQKPRAVVYQES